MLAIFFEEVKHHGHCIGGQSVFDGSFVRQSVCVCACGKFFGSHLTYDLRVILQSQEVKGKFKFQNFIWPSESAISLNLRM